MVTSVPPCEAWWGRENCKSWSTSRKAPMAVWKQPQTHRDHVWNFWASQRQSLCHTKSGPAHAKLRSFGIFLNPCLPFVFLAYLWLHQVRESSQVPLCSWCSSAERFGCWGPACTHQPSNSRLNTNRKTTRTTKKAFKLVCTKTFPKMLLSWRV